MEREEGARCRLLVGLVYSICERKGRARVVGFDHEASQVKDAVDYLRSGNNLCLADAVHMPFWSGLFDVVVSMHVLEHVEPEKGMMDEIRRVLKPDGVLLISVPNDLSFGVLPYRPLRLLLQGKMAAMLPFSLRKYVKSLSYSDLSHHREYTARSISGLLQSNGFQVEQVWCHGLDLPYPLKGRIPPAGEAEDQPGPGKDRSRHDQNFYIREGKKTAKENRVK